MKNEGNVQSDITRMLKIGADLTVEFDDLEPVTTTLVGIMPNKFVIITPTRLESTKKNITKGTKAKIKFLFQDNFFEFETKLVEITTSPVEMLMLEYPGAVRQNERRSLKRSKCFIPTKVDLCGLQQDGIIRDISKKGCRCNILNTRNEITSCVNKKITLTCKFPGKVEETIIEGQVNNSQIDGEIITVGILLQNISDELQQVINQYVLSIEDFS